MTRTDTRPPIIVLMERLAFEQLNRFINQRGNAMNVARLPTRQKRYEARIEACATALDPAISSCANRYGTWILIAALTQSYGDVLHHLYLTDRAQAQALLYKLRQIMETP